MIQEEEIINMLKYSGNNLSQPFIGDDAAIIPYNKDKSYIITKDILIEDVHFNRKYFNVYSLAHKAIHVNISDIAAMGGSPKYLLLGIAVNKDFEQDVMNFMQHAAEICRELRVDIVGGDTVRSSDKVMISLTVIGEADNCNIKLRSKAQIGDIVCYIGNLGHAKLGLNILENAFDLDKNNYRQYANTLLLPTAKTEEGKWLGSTQYVNSMMDVSDGLYVDLSKLCRASSVSAKISLDNLYYDDEYKKCCNTMHIDPIVNMLSGGEDYGLLFTVSAVKYDDICRDFYKQFAYNITKIGDIVVNKEDFVLLKRDGADISIKLDLFSHFGEL